MSRGTGPGQYNVPLGPIGRCQTAPASKRLRRPQLSNLLAPDTAAFRERSVKLFNDPKMDEMKHFLESHTHEDRMRKSVVGTPTGKGTLQPRVDGVRMVDAILRRIASEAPDKACSAKSNPASSDVVEQPFGSFLTEVDCSLPSSRLQTPRDTKGSSTTRFPPITPRSLTSAGAPPGQEPKTAASALELRMQGRLQWRHEMDRQMRRLLTDMEITRHDPLLEEHSHRLVCEHFDRLYDWYIMFGSKEVQKEREGSAFLRFDAGGPVMPGSLRTPRQ